MELLYEINHGEITAMKFKTWSRHFRECIKSVIRNGWMSIASIGAVTVTLILVGTFVTIILNVNEMAAQVERDVEIKVLISDTADETSIGQLRSQIESLETVDSIVFSSKEDELAAVIAGMGDEGKVWEMVEDDNPLNHAFIVKATNPRDTETVAAEIE